MTVTVKVHCSKCGVVGEMELALRSNGTIAVDDHSAPEDWQISYDYEHKSTYCPRCVKDNWL